MVYMSPTIQNDLLSCCVDVLRAKILDDVRASPFFAVLADEAVDTGNKEQMPIILFVDAKSLEIREEFLDFAVCEDGKSGASLAKIILDHL